ncbi:MAG: LysR family transcriptional regulator [Myxococcales bacterium]|nr:LysR family transcriptional regulator [Myxococcales bacterium]
MELGGQMQLGAFTLEELSLLLAVLESGSLSVVAEQHGVSTSKLSKLVRAVEDALGGQLFLRKGAALEITPAAVTFKRQLERAVQSAGGLSLADRRTDHQLAVAFDPLIVHGMAALPGALGVDRLRVLTISSEYAREFADQCTYDVGFFLGPVTPPANWHSESVGQVTFSFVRTNAESQEPPRYVFWSLLSRQGLVRRRLLPMQFQPGAGPQIEVQQFETLKGLLRDTSCIVCLPHYLQREELIGRFEPLADAGHPSFDTNVIAVCDDERVSASVFAALCSDVAAAARR